MTAAAKTSKRTRASAVVELVILLPVFLLIIYAMMYVGELSLYKQRTHFGGEYAMDASGDQSEDRAVRGTVTDQFYAGSIGKLALIERAADPPEIPQPGEIQDLFDEMTQPIYSTYATGRYVFSGGQLRFIVDTHQSQKLSRDGKYVMKYGLKDDNIPELTTELLQAWAERHRVELTYSYAPDYISIGRWPLEAVDLSTALQSVVRTDKTREVTGAPPGMTHQIDTVTGNHLMPSSGELPNYPDFSGDEPFWEPN